MKQINATSKRASCVYQRGLHYYAIALSVATFILVVSGGNVTSHDAGLSVPDGFTVYGYFLWFFPKDQWVGNIFYEHIHRLKGSVVGLLSIGLAIWLWRTQAERPWLKRFGLFILLLVIIQGIMGGLRVEFVNHFPYWATPFAIFHAITGQIFFAMTILAAAACGRFWIQQENHHTQIANLKLPIQLRTLCLLTLAVLLIQLTLGAAMRHTQSGLAIPDFPTSYGQILPPLNQAALDQAVDNFPYDSDVPYYQINQVYLNFSHRVWALMVMGIIGWCVHKILIFKDLRTLIKTPLRILSVLLVLQVALGALIIWTGRQPDIATAHQSIGALMLGTMTFLTSRIYLLTHKPKHFKPQQVAINHASDLGGAHA